MSGRKNVLRLFQFATNQTMASSFTSIPTSIEFLDNVGVQLDWTGTPTGTISIQISMNYQQDSLGNIINAGNWIPLNLSITQPAGSSGDLYVDLNQLSAPWIRTVYTASSGTGSLNGYICAKEV